MASEDADHLIFKKPGDFGDLHTLRGYAEDLQDITVDIDKLSAFAPPEKIKIGAVTGQFAPDSGSGLQVSTDLGKLDDGLRKLREQEADAKLRRLLEQAQQKMAQNKFHIAISLLDQALEIDQTSASAWLLKSQCCYVLGELDRALELLAKAQEHARDSKTTMLALMLRAVCERKVIEQVESELVELINNGDLNEAGRLVERTLRKMPNNAALHYHHCEILLMMGRMAEAKAVAESSLAIVGESNTHLFHELLKQIAVKESSKYLEAARLALRQGNTKDAIKQLDSCSGALSGNEQFEALRSYAHERFAYSSRWALVRRTRMQRANVPPLDVAALQPVLLWLLHDELEAGLAALSKDDFTKADRYFTNAEKIDARSAILAFLHAVTMFKGLERSFASNSPPSPDEAASSLRRAFQLATQASEDPVARKQSDTLAAVVNANLRALDKIRMVTECISRFNALMSHYERYPIRSTYELTAAKNSLLDIREDVEIAWKDHAPDSEGRRVLDQLEGAISRVMTQLSPRSR